MAWANQIWPNQGWPNQPAFTPTTAIPIFSPSAGAYAFSQSISISCSTPGATIYYTTDGSVPTIFSAVYSGPIFVSQNMVISALAIAPGFLNSAVGSAAYSIIRPRFNSVRSGLFPQLAFPGDLWYAWDTTQLFMAVSNPNQLFPGVSADQNFTRIWEMGLNVAVVQQTQVPRVSTAGNIFLTTDTLQAFAGTGISVVRFRLDVARALRGGMVSSRAGAPSNTLGPAFFASLSEG